MRVGLYAACASVVMLCGCATLPRTDVASVPVTVPCIARSDVPLYPELRSPAAWTQPNLFERQRALIADYYDLAAYAERVRPLLAACTKEE
jgi:hypothetical protein